MVREFCDSDFNEVTNIGNLIEENYKLIFNNTSKCYVYKNDDKVVGFILFNILIDEIEITDIAVCKNYQGVGIASEIIKFVNDYARNSNIEKIILECREKVVPFYEKNGFTTYNIRKGYYSNPVEDAFLMQKEVV